VAAMTDELMELMGRFCTDGARAAPLRFGALNLQRLEAQMKAYQPMMEYLSARLGRRVEYIPTATYDALVAAMAEGAIDFAHLGPAQYVEAADRHGVRAVVKMLQDGEPYYYSYFIARADSPLQGLGDLRGRTFGFGDRKSTSGHVVPRLTLVKAGIDPDRDLKEYRFLGNHDNVVEAVLKGVVDAGAVEDGVFEKYKTQPLKVIGRSDPILHFPWAVRPGLPEELVQALQAALVECRDPAVLRPIHPRLSGFAPASDGEYDFFRRLRREAA